jgi:uncharacterized protein (UPF0548 family)
VFRITSVSTQDLSLILDRARRTQPTYQHVGATAEPELPTGYRHDEYQRILEGPDAFKRGREGLKRWKAHLAGPSWVTP